MSGQRTPLGRLIQRRAEWMVEEALTDTRVVLVNGARQSGKSTLARLIAKRHGAEWHTFDSPETRQAADYDPTGFVQRHTPMVIDEIQRLPELLLSIKERVDTDQRPGSFLLTGSARLLSLRTLPDTLVGRMETIELWPFSQGEIDSAPDRFVDAVFAHGHELQHQSSLARQDYAERAVRGGFPESVARPHPRRRARFLDAYLADVANRDIVQLARIEHLDEMRTLMQLVAARSGQLLVPGSLANAVHLPTTTVQRYLRLLQEIFLIKRIPAWSRNLSSRATRTPKVAMVDSGIAARLMNTDAGQLGRPENSQFGPLLEGFVLMELARQLTWSEERVDLFHYRTRDKVEVDAVLEGPGGRVVGIEIKAAATVRGEDFRGLRHLAERVGDDFVVGIVLYTGEQTYSFGPRLLAMPVSALWNVAP